MIKIISNNYQERSEQAVARPQSAFKNMPERLRNDINSNNTKVTTKLILSHIFSGDTLENEKKKGGLALSLDGSIYYTYDVGDLFVKDIVVQGNPFLSGNYRVIPVNCVMFLQQTSKDKRLDKEIRSKYSLTSCSLQDKKEYKKF